jgi:hypothetical protein
MIYLTNEDWSNLILSKLTNKEDFIKEFAEFNRIYNIIYLFCRKIYNNPNEQQMILIASLIIFHKFRICSDFSLSKYSSEELYILFGTCLYIGQRAINSLKTKINDIAYFIKQIVNKKIPKNNVEINDLNKKLIQKEYDILTLIGFNIEIDSPFFFYHKLKKYLLKTELNSVNFFTLLNYIIKDSYILPLSLYYTPNTIVISCVNILREKYKINLINIKEIIGLSEYPINNEDIIQCTSLIEKIEGEIKNKNNQKKNNNNNENKKEIGDKGDNLKENQISSQASITKVIPSIKMNID